MGGRRDGQRRPRVHDLHPYDPTTIALDVDAQQTWGLDLTGATITRTSAAASNALGSVSDDNRISTKLELPPRTVVLVEIGR